MIIDKSSACELRLSRALRILLYILFIMVLYHSLINGLGYQWPHDTFLFQPGDRFNDWHNATIAANTGNPYYSHTHAINPYFPLTYFLLDFIPNLTRTYSLLVYLSLVALLVLVFVYSFSKSECNSSSLTSSLWVKYALLVLCTYPVLFSLDRGNIDIVIALLLGVWLFTFTNRNSFLPHSLLALAIALKGYPLIFLFLTFRQRKYKELFFTIILSCLLFILPLLYFPGDFQYQLDGFLNSLDLYRETYVVGKSSLFASSDAYNGIRSLFLILGYDFDSKSLISNYHIFSFLFLIFTVSFVIFSRADDFLAYTLFFCVVIFFPDVANDYKLTLAIPVYFYYWLRSDSYPYLKYLLLLLMIPKSLIFVNGVGLTNLINPILILSIFFYSLYYYYNIESSSEDTRKKFA